MVCTTNSPLVVQVEQFTSCTMTVRAVASKIKVVRPEGKNVGCVMMLDCEGCKILQFQFSVNPHFQHQILLQHHRLHNFCLAALQHEKQKATCIVASMMKL